MHASALPVLLFVFPLALLIGALIGAVFLRAGISLYNAMAGGERSKRAAPMPSFGKAMGIVVIAAIVNWFSSFLIGMLMGAAGAVSGAEPKVVLVIAQLIAIPASLLVMAAMITAFLPTTFGRAILITLCYMLVVILVAVVLVVAIMAVALVVRIST